MATIQPAEAKVQADEAQLATDEAALATAEAAVQAGPYYYCLEENHPGAPNFQTSPLSLTRIFQSSEAVPVCPACGRQTNSVPCDGPDIPPAYILDLQERFGR